MDIFNILLGTFRELYYIILGVSTGGSFPRKLTASEEADCLRRLSEGDAQARAQLIEHNLRLVSHITRKYFLSQTDSEDMLSVGTIGLIKAVDSYSPEKCTKFSSFASRCIENECLMYLRAAKKTSLNVSISAPIDTDKHGNELTLLDIISCEDTIADDLDTKLKCQQLRGLIARLDDPREAEIIWMRYGLDGKEPLTQKEIAAKLDISRSYVSRIEKKALEQLRQMLG
ncbi:MAG: sigma-70 family RNA polymerase sigma factor [Ruminococcaceae bacterium]|nr:sigma-70 family RNA polymerase sigma factor [Oscillospiraceae bacterium]